jgi:hypothetical protein
MRKREIYTTHLRLCGPAIGHGVRGGLVGAKQPKMSCWDSVFMGCLCFGQREPGWGQEILAEEGGSSAGMQSESWFDLTESFSVPSHFPNPLPRPTFSNPPLPLPQTFWWVVCGWDVVVDGGWWWKRKDWWQCTQVVQSPLRLTEFLTPFQFICLTAPSRNCLNFSKYRYTH